MLKEINLYTDGACSGNPGPGGYCAILSFSGKEKIISGGFRKTTNNRMELRAVIEGLKALKEKCKVNIYSDSKYIVDAFELGWITKWEKLGWNRNKKDKLINPDLWKKLYSLIKQHEVTFNWVKGHNGNPFNERCDVLAVSAIKKNNLPADEFYEYSPPELFQ